LPAEAHPLRHLGKMSHRNKQTSRFLHTMSHFQSQVQLNEEVNLVHAYKNMTTQQNAQKKLKVISPSDRNAFDSSTPEINFENDGVATNLKVEPNNRNRDLPLSLEEGTEGEINVISNSPNSSLTHELYSSSRSWSDMDDNAKSSSPDKT
jgi:hypothetical protein